ncbi:sacsin-like [Xenia sp. Carnegie-2017]|uniref:sacsin-like n=1 Tax=Xenia sp. Carnegie-2017 TaxID=2897299 RepID=UPI001F03E206|nr:sacsin-like [Xenia sp. Carnegie-2017]
MPVTGRFFGQERPPLTDILKNILLRYPDGGQILKELIQNADDAGARDVKILFDASSFGTSSLVSQNLELFQGSALYFFNNALFTEDDWKGLQRLMRSNKKDNPLKVGRFGIGFNSVYHITDLPSIASGNRIAFLDPHEKYFVRGEPGQAFSLEDPLLDEHFDQFHPFHKILECDLSQGIHHYDGTLFRFPLRTQPSELSQKIYTKEMVMSLFESFRNEAHAILLFLKNIESISLYERENHGEIVHLFTAKISEESRNEVRKSRLELIQDISVDWNFAARMTFHRMKIEIHCPDKEIEIKEWFLANQVGTRNEQLIELANNLKLLPWIGIAFPVDINNNDLSFLGRIFCFLPLPPESRTGLPVQVNGYFGLTDNRRALKWPGPDCLNDETAQWNQLLLKDIGSHVYASLIVNIVRDCHGKYLPELTAKIVYASLPALDDVRPEWKCIIQPLLCSVLVEKIFFTMPINGYRWVDLGEAVLNRLNVREEMKDAVLFTLLSAGEPVITVPQHVLQAIDEFHEKCGWQCLKNVTPEYLCNVLRSYSQFHGNEISFEKKLLLLEYVLLNVPDNIKDLWDVALLPLENGNFLTFSRTNVDKIFISSHRHSADLLPNMKHRLLLSSLPREVKIKLDEVGRSQYTQLRHPTPEDIKHLLWQNFPLDWANDSYSKPESVYWNPEIEGQPTRSWLELVWKWINDNYPDRLNEFQEMYLIPVTWTVPCKMAKLSYHSSIILDKHPSCFNTLSNKVSDLLKRSGCIVVQELPSFVKHNQLLQYVSLPTPNGILEVMHRVGKNVNDQLSMMSNEIQDEICSIFSKLDNIKMYHVSFIQSLPIFQALDGSNYLSCIDSNGQFYLVAPRDLLLPKTFHFINREKIISSSKIESYSLLLKLGVKVESNASLLMHNLETFLDSDSSDDYKDDVVLWILQKIEMLIQETPAFLKFIRRVHSIPTASGRRMPPSSLFDHSDNILIRLFSNDQSVFPTDHFSHIVNKRKQELKIRRRDDLKPDDILDLLRKRSSISSDQGLALVELFNQHLLLLKQLTADGRQLKNVLSGLPWLPRVLDRTNTYPDFMPWYYGDTVCCPNTMLPDSWSLLVGATVPIFKERLVSSEVRDLVGVHTKVQQSLWNNIFQQLKIAVHSWFNEETTPVEVANFQEMIKNIYLVISKLSTDMVAKFLKNHSLVQWVWHGNGFTAPENVAFESPFPKNIDLHPYLFCLPRDLFVVKDFLVSHGAKLSFDVKDLLNWMQNIKKRHDSSENVPHDEVMHDLDQCRGVLEWIVRSKVELSEDLRRKLLIPVQTKPDKLKLEPCHTCTYCDREFLRRGVSEYQFSIKSHLIHKAIPEDLARRLKVPRLSNCLAGAKAIGINFVEAGQYEPLTTRLRNILQQYKEGVAIFKELIQNADDARATKVYFVIDWRNNSCETLLSDQLSPCQGPALYAYNDAMFSDEDFGNINKLAGETKKEDLEKVGRFGLGFNSVYHLTDVPSFVSGENLVIFDPNMTHISDLIDRNSRQGGLMLSFADNSHVLSAFPDQFLPYHQLFGCDMSGDDAFYFPGTLFRFPFRTELQARTSGISKEPYTPENIKNLVKSLTKASSTLLLFSQNVKEVRVFEIQKNSNPKLSLTHPLITVTKTIEKTLFSNLKKGESMLKSSSDWFRQNRLKRKLPKEGPRCTMLININVCFVKADLNDVSNPCQMSEKWLVNSCTGCRLSFQVARSDEGVRNGVVPVTGVATKIDLLNRNDVKIQSVPGEVYCFMPLSIESGLPVHVNGSFSVYSNRRRLWEEGVGEHQLFKPFEAKWNEALMEDSLVQAYFDLLLMLQSYNAKQYEFHCLWPNPTKVHHPRAWRPFLDSFFNSIIDEEVKVFKCRGKWTKLQDCLILDPKLSKQKESVAIMNHLGENVLSIPPNFMEAFQSCGKGEFINNHLLTEDKFLKEYFFPNASRISADLRSSVLVHILTRRLKKHRDYDDLLKTVPCFSCSKDGMILRTSNELVHPKGKAACLFYEHDKRFPLDDRLLEKELAMMLEELGMIVDFLPWSSLCERAKSISDQRDIVKINLMIKFMNDMPSDAFISEEGVKILRETPFLPILSKPSDYPFSWKFDHCRGMQFADANSLHLEKFKYLVGTKFLILDESSKSVCAPNLSLKKILRVSSKKPKISDVIEQLDRIIVSTIHLADEQKEKLCFTIYEYFQSVVITKNVSQDQIWLREQLESRSWLFVKGQLVNAAQVAQDWNKKTL